MKEIHTYESIFFLFIIKILFFRGQMCYTMCKTIWCSNINYKAIKESSKRHSQLLTRFGVTSYTLGDVNPKNENHY
jgi:sulfite exporter TauE/SafE